jgi:hypothetical protein
MTSKIVAFAILLIGSIGLFPSASAFGVGAHQHVGKTIFGGIDPNDCSIPVDVIGATPFRARLNERVCRAIRGNRDAFLAGVIGPDTFPDLIVGQLTAHPGVVGGWQAADWLRHLLTNASSDEEVAFAYGYVVHGATDVFAHSYVNHYAGDVFDLARGGTGAEARHFALEKFIDVMLLRHDVFAWGFKPDPHAKPMTVELEGVPPAEWLARVLILDPSVSAQWTKPLAR